MSHLQMIEFLIDLMNVTTLVCEVNFVYIRHYSLIT